MTLSVGLFDFLHGVKILTALNPAKMANGSAGGVSLRACRTTVDGHRIPDSVLMRSSSRCPRVALSGCVATLACFAIRPHLARRHRSTRSHVAPGAVAAGEHRRLGRERQCRFNSVWELPISATGGICPRAHRGRFCRLSRWSGTVGTIVGERGENPLGEARFLSMMSILSAIRSGFR
jgi:hypothetical protein